MPSGSSFPFSAVNFLISLNTLPISFSGSSCGVTPWRFYCKVSDVNFFSVSSQFLRLILMSIFSSTLVR